MNTVSFRGSTIREPELAERTERLGAASSPVLLNVEDFEPSRFRRTRLLQDAGFQVLEAASAGEALSAATPHRLSVALIDVHLPDSSGITLCDTLKRLDPELPVLLISGISLSHEAEEAWPRVLAAILVNPWPLKHLCVQFKTP